MRLYWKHLKYVYGRIIEDTIDPATQAKILILPSMTTDSVCATRIICSLIQQLNQGTTYTVMPVRGQNDVIVSVESMIEHSEPGKGLSIICIGHSGDIDLKKVFNLDAPERQNKVVFTVFDSRRPFNLRNLNASNSQVRIILDQYDLVDDWETQLPIDIDSDEEDFYYRSKSQYVGQNGEFDAQDDDEYYLRAQREYQRAIGGLAGDYDEYDDADEDDEGGRAPHGGDENEDEDEDGEFDDSDFQVSKRQRNRHSIRSGDHDDSDVELGYGSDDERDVTRYGDDDDDDDNDDLDPSGSRAKKRKSRLSPADLDDLGDNDGDNDNEISHGGKEKRELKQRLKKGKKPLPPPPQIYRSQMTWDQAVEYYGKEPMSRKEYEKAKKDFSARTLHQSPVSYCMYILARFQRAQTPNMLWCAFTGLTEALIYEKYGFQFYSRLYDALTADIESSQVRFDGQNAVIESTSGQLAAPNSVSKLRGAYSTATGKDMQSSSGFLQLDPRVQPGAAPRGLSMEHGLSVGTMIETEHEYIFPFLRHWSLYQSLLNTPAVLIAFKLYRDTEGLKKLKQILAKLPIQLQEAQRPYSLLNQATLQIFFRNIQIYLSQYDINEVFLKTYIIRVSTTMVMSLNDFTVSLLQYLDTVICNCGDESHHFTAQSIRLLEHVLDSTQPGTLSQVQQRPFENNNSAFASAEGSSLQRQDSRQVTQRQSSSDAILAIGSSTSSFWPSYNILTPTNTQETIYQSAIKSAIAQHTKINDLATTIFKSKAFLKTHDTIHYCLIPLNSILPAQDIPILTSYHALTQLSFRLQELVATRYQSAPFLLGISLPSTDYTLIIGQNPIVKTNVQNKTPGVHTRFSRNTYSQFHNLFIDAATRMGVDFVKDSFEANLIYIKNDDVVKFTQQLVLLASRKEVRDKFYPNRD